MTALATGRNTPYRLPGLLSGALAASVVVFAGAIVMRNASGYLTKGATGLNLVGAGVAEEAKTGGASAGDETIRYRADVHRLANSASTDEITIADIGKVCFCVDDQTVAKTSGSGTRSPVGFVADVDSLGVWVEFDEAKLRTWVAQRKRIVQLRLTTIAGSGSPAYRVISPFSGLVTRIQSIIELALTSADATLTAAIAGTGITNGVITVTQSGSAAGDKDSASPTAANYVTAGDELKVTVTGTQAAAAPANVIFEIDAD